MPKVTKKREHAISNSMTLNQALTIYKPIIRTRVNKVSAFDQQLIEAAFFIKDDVGWELTSNCAIYARDAFFYVKVLWRRRIRDRRGVRKTSQQYTTALEAENNAFSFRYNLESANSKMKIDIF